MSSFTAPSSTNDAAEGKSELQQNLDRYRQVWLFSGLALEPLKLLAYLSTRETLKPGEPLFHRGELPTAMAVVLAGTLHAYAAAEAPPAGAREPDASFGPGDCVGGLALLGKETHNYTVVAAEPLSYLTLSREKLQRAMQQYPDIGLKLCEALATRVSQWDRSALDALARQETRLGVSLL
ncbi:MAG: cyclic nucleotide-binding domain-containing protein [Desulfovibrio sp.]|nr:cyclic nucleotide-binding domain-containing protein [Desulfovibrio sp.]MCA1985415.1 cyclic nucleotide-binding domain-containing protein [Desulfovibrio sp.]